MIGYDKHNAETYDTQGEDHVIDCVCYALMSRPFAPTKAKPVVRDGYKREKTLLFGLFEKAVRNWK